MISETHKLSPSKWQIQNNDSCLCTNQGRAMLLGTPDIPSYGVFNYKAILYEYLIEGNCNKAHLSDLYYTIFLCLKFSQINQNFFKFLHIPNSELVYVIVFRIFDPWKTRSKYATIQSSTQNANVL